MDTNGFKQIFQQHLLPNSIRILSRQLVRYYIPFTTLFILTIILKNRFIKQINSLFSNVSDELAICQDHRTCFATQRLTDVLWVGNN
jgi:hypothetical protein